MDMDAKTMRTQTVEALRHSWKEAENRLHALRFKLSSNQLKHVRDVREIRAEIARLKTLIREKS